MKKLFLILITISLISCGESKINELNKKVTELENANAQLRDSILELRIKKVLKSSTFALTTKPYYEVGDTVKVNLKFSYPEKIWPYNVYTVDENWNLDELLFENLSDNEFNYEFIAEKSGERKIELMAVFKPNMPEYSEIEVMVNSAINIKD